MRHIGEPVTQPYNEILLSVEHTDKKTLDGFNHFWGCHVTGFDDEKHCLECFIGKREEKIENKMQMIPDSAPITIPMQGNYFYICGVTNHLKFSHEEYMANNFHLPLQWKPGSIAKLTTYNGYTFTVRNAEIVPFTSEVAETHYRQLGEKFWTCRNFQFGAQMYVKK